MLLPKQSIFSRPCSCFDDDHIFCQPHRLPKKFQNRSIMLIVSTDNNIDGKIFDVIDQKQANLFFPENVTADAFGEIIRVVGDFVCYRELTKVEICTRGSKQVNSRHWKQRRATCFCQHPSVLNVLAMVHQLKSVFSRRFRIKSRLLQ